MRLTSDDFKRHILGLFGLDQHCNGQLLRLEQVDRLQHSLPTYQQGIQTTIAHHIKWTIFLCELIRWKNVAIFEAQLLIT